MRVHDLANGLVRSLLDLCDHRARRFWCSSRVENENTVRPNNDQGIALDRIDTVFGITGCLDTIGRLGNFELLVLRRCGGRHQQKQGCSYKRSHGNSVSLQSGGLAAIRPTISPTWSRPKLVATLVKPRFETRPENDG